MSETPEIINEEPIIEESINTTSEEEKSKNPQLKIQESNCLNLKVGKF